METTYQPKHHNFIPKPKTSKPKPLITTKDIVDRIQSAGYKVKIVHHRFFGKRLLKNSDIRILLKALKIMKGGGVSIDGNIIDNCGGLTTVEVIKGDNKYFAKADCSLSDPFVYSKAGRLALYRVLDQLPEEDLQSFKKEMQAIFLCYQLQLKNGNCKWTNFDEPVNERTNLISRMDEINNIQANQARIVEVFE